MADVVNYRLERTLPELEDLQKRLLFTRSEIALIVQKRRKFEYRLKRPSPLKQDFLDYIEYEKQLDRLRRLRKKASVSDGNAPQKRNKVSASDVAGVRHVIELYRMVTKRFKGDIELWFQYLEFCKEKKNGRMKKALAEVMRFHPKVPAVWIYAAAWEYDHNLNFESALSLMQTGLRACPSSENLWVECVRLILTHLNKLRTRKVMLGEENNTLVGDNKQMEEKKWHDENEDLFMSLDDENGVTNGSDAQTKDPNKWNTLWVTVLQETYREAVKALPSSFSLRKRFLEIVEATDLGHLEEVRTEILDGMRKDFSGGPGYWDWLATLKLTSHTAPDINSEERRLQVDEAIKVYEEATNILPSAVMFEKYIKFLIDTINSNGEEKQNAGLSSVSDHIADYISQLVSVFSKAEATGCLSEDLACEYVKFYLRMDRVDEALKLAEKFCDGNFSDAKQLWVLRVTEQMKCIKESGVVSKAALSSVYHLFHKMVKDVAVSDVENLWLMALDLFANNKKYFGKFLDFSLVVLVKDGGTDYGFSLPATLVKFVCQKDGIHKARDMYKRLITLPHPGLGLYKHCIELENSTGDEASITNARKLFECALAAYSQDISLWQDYYSMEIKAGTSETANGIYWRAKKTLGDASALLASSTS